MLFIIAQFIKKAKSLLVGHAGGNFKICLEKPFPFDKAANEIEVRGWAFSYDESPIAGRVLVGNRHVCDFAIDKIRKDVTEVFNLGDKGRKVGFQKRIAWAEIGPDVTQTELYVEFSQGSDVRLFGPYKISKTKSPILPHERGSYKDVWNEASETYFLALAAVGSTTNNSEFFASGRITASTLKKVLHITEDDDVLEIGCGVGRVGVALAPCCAQWIGADISGQMLEHAKKNLSQFSNVKLVELKTNVLSEFENNSFDKVYCTTVFMHLDEWDRYKYVRETFRVLRPGGMCYFDNLNLCGEEGWAVFEELSQFDSAGRPANISKMSTEEELRCYLEQAGFEVVHVYPASRYVTVVGRRP